MALFSEATAKQTQAFVNQVLAATATQEDPIFTAPRKCVVLEINVVPQTATTGDNTNSKTLNTINKGTAGVGTTQVSTLVLATGVNLVAFQKQNFAFNAAYAAGHNMAAGEVLTLQTAKVGTGVIVGPFIVSVVWQPLE